MSIWDWLFGNRRPEFKLSDVDPEEVRADQIRLERQEQKLEQEIERDRRQIEEITQQAVDAGRETTARTATRKIMQLKERIKDRERSMHLISRELMALGRMQRLFGARDRAEHSHVFARLTNLSPGLLERLLTGEIAREEARERGVLDIVEILDGPVTAQSEIEESPEAEEIYNAIVQAQKVGDRTIVAATLEKQEHAEREDWERL